MRVLFSVALLAAVAAADFSPAKMTAPPAANWPTNGGNLYNERYSPLKTIDRSNVSQLKRFRRVAIANWRAGVPAGVYARSYLMTMNAWRDVETRAIPTVDVRAALAAFDSGAVDAAIVYRTDERLAKRRHATLALDATSIVYPAAVIRKSAVAQRFFDFLFSDEATRIFTRYGFTLPTKR